MSKDDDGTLVMTYGCAAAFSAEDDGTVTLPFELETGRAIHLDAGTRDQFWLDLGAQAVVRELERIGVTDIHFELFDATHTAIDYRYPIGLGYLAERLGSGI